VRFIVTIIITKEKKTDKKEVIKIKSPQKKLRKKTFLKRKTNFFFVKKKNSC